MGEHKDHNKGHDESLMWHICFLNVALELACFIDFYGWYSDSGVGSWYIKKENNGLLRCTRCRDIMKERNRDLQIVEPAGRMAIDTSALLSLLVPYNLSIPYPVSRFYLVSEGFCQIKVV